MLGDSARESCCASCPVMERLLLFFCRQSIHQLSLPNLALNEQHNPCVCTVHTYDKSPHSCFFYHSFPCLSLTSPMPFALYTLFCLCKPCSLLQDEYVLKVLLKHCLEILSASMSLPFCFNHHIFMIHLPARQERMSLCL